jgi:hypothetical protein
MGQVLSIGSAETMHEQPSPARRMAQLAWAPLAPTLSRLQAQAGQARIHRLLYDAVVESAPPGRAPRAAALSALAAEAGIDLRDAHLAGPDGPVTVTALLGHELDGPVYGDVLAAALALAYGQRLEGRDGPARRVLATRLVAALPALERWAHATPADYIFAVCGGQEAARFWQTYADRIAIELNQRAPKPGVERPWRLADMLDVGAAPQAPPSAAWTTLLRHVRRLLRAPVDGSALVRRFVDRCHDPRMLRVVCNSPVVLGDHSVQLGWLTRGGSNAIGAALFVLNQDSGESPVIAQLIAHFSQRPLPEVGERVVDIHGQIHLLPAPSAALRRLAQALVSEVGNRARQGSIAAILEALQPDPRAFRHSLLLVEASFSPELWDVPQGRQLLERVVSTWIAGFTAAALDHPHNDGRYRSAVARALVALLEQRADTINTLVQLLDDLEQRAAEAGSPAAARQLESRLRANFAAVIRLVARARRGAPDGEALWALLVRAGETIEATDDWFGPVASVLPFFEAPAGPPEWLIDLDRQTISVAASSTPEISAPAPQAVEAVGAPAARVVQAPTVRGLPAIEVSVRRLKSAPGVWAQVLSGYSGWSVLSGLGAGLAHRLGYVEAATARVADEQLTVERDVAYGGSTLGGHSEQRTLAELVGVHIRRPLHWFPLVLGGVSLLGGGLAGGHLVFAGLRAEMDLWVAGGVALLVGAFAADTVLTRHARQAARSVWVELQWHVGKAWQLELDTEGGAPLLDALMAGEAARREVARRGLWVEAEGIWQGDEDAARARLADVVLEEAQAQDLELSTPSVDEVL